MSEPGAEVAVEETEPRLRVRRIWILLALLVVLEVRQLGAGRYLIDDAFISFRYAGNLVAGEGLVFNPGERVEGYSNLLLVLLVAGGMRVGWSPETLSLVIGHLAGVTAVTLLWLLSVSVRGRREGAAVIAPLLLALSPQLAFWAGGGLETTLDAALLLALVYGLRRLLLSGDRAAVAIGVVAGGGFLLSRPENLFVVAALLGSGLWWAVRKGPAGAARAWSRVALPLLAAGALLLLWRMSYYGALLPNSVLAKSFYGYHFENGAPWSGILADLFLHPAAGGYIAETVRAAGGWAVVAVALIGLCRRDAGALRYLVVPPLAFSLGAVLWNSGDWMPHGRLLVRTLPFLFLLFQEGLVALVGFRRLAAPLPRLRLGVLVGVTGMLALASAARRYDPPDPEFGAALETVGSALDRAGKGEALLATTVGGRIGYRYRGPVLEMFGLTDAVVARGGRPIRRMGRLKLGYVADREPAFLVLNSEPIARWLFEDRPGLQAGYLQVVSDRLRRNDLQLFVRRSSPPLDALREALPGLTLQGVDSGVVAGWRRAGD